MMMCIQVFCWPIDGPIMSFIGPDYKGKVVFPNHRVFPKAAAYFNMNKSKTMFWETQISLFWEHGNWEV